MVKSSSLFHLSALRLLWMLQLRAVASVTPCTLCADGISSATIPTAQLEIPGVGKLPCSVIEASIGAFLPDDTADDCKSIRSISSLCGCPKPAGESSCELCRPIGEGLSVPDTRLDKAIPFLDYLLQSQMSTDPFAMTCGLLQASLHSFNEVEQTCSVAQGMLSEYCCLEDRAPPGEKCNLCSGGTDSFSNGSQSLSSLVTSSSVAALVPTCQVAVEAAELFSKGTEECSDLQSLVESQCVCGAPEEDLSPLTVDETTDSDGSKCSLCRDGSDVTMPDRVIGFAESSFGFAPTCLQAQVMSGSLDADSKECRDAQMSGSYCGCPAIENACVLCPGEEVTDPDRRHGMAYETRGLNVTCSELEALMLQVDEATDLCYVAQYANWECGCNDGFYGYMGTTSIRDKMLGVLNILPKISGTLSLLGCLFIFQDYWRGDRTNLYRQIIFVASWFDFVTAVSWIIGSAAIPAYDVYGNDTNIYGAKGNDATCTAQGFFMTLGYAGAFYQISLSSYYVMTVVWNWKANQLDKARKWLLSMPILASGSIAGAGIPSYTYTFFGCSTMPRPFSDSNEMYYLAVIPILFTVLYSITCQIIVYLKVRKQVRASWQFSFDISSKLMPFGKNRSMDAAGGMVQTDSEPERRRARRRRTSTTEILTSTNAEAAVFWQAFFYVLIMLLSWTSLVTGILIARSTSFAFWSVFAFFGPIQGFLKCLLYVRPRFMKWRRERKKKRKRADRVKRQEALRKEKAMPPQEAPLGSQEMTCVFSELKENFEAQSMDTPYSSGDESYDGLSDEFNDSSSIYPSLI